MTAMKLVPVEPTDTILEAWAKKWGNWAEPSEDVTECGVIVEPGLSDVDCAHINAMVLTDLREQYKSLVECAAAPSPATDSGGHAEIVDSTTVRMRDDALQSPAAQRQIEALRRIASPATDYDSLIADLRRNATWHKAIENAISYDVETRAAAAIASLTAEVAARDATIDRLRMLYTSVCDHFEQASKRYERAEAEVARLRAALEAKQSKIDWLMLEYCPDEMTPEQLAEWGRNQVPVSKEKRDEIDAAARSEAAKGEG